MSRKVAPSVYESRGFHFWVKQVNGVRKWVRLGKVGPKGWRDITAESHEAIAAIKRKDTRGGMAGLFDRYAKEVLPTKAPKTQDEQLRQLQKLRDAFGTADPPQVRTMHVAAYLDATMHTRPVAGNREIALLSDVFRCAIRWGKCEINPCTGVRRNKEQPRDRAVTDAEFWAVHAAAREPIQHAMELALLTGQRIGDLLRATWKSVTPEGLAFKQSKTKKKLIVSLSPDLAELIERCKARARAQAVTMLDPPLIVSQSGGRYTGSGFSTEWQKLMRGRPERFTFHDIRSLSADHHATGDHLGHANPATTRRIYNRRPRHVDPAGK